MKKRYRRYRPVWVIMWLSGIISCQSAIKPHNAANDFDGLSAAPDAADIYVELGALYLGEGKLDEALNNARKAISVNTDSSPAHNLLGVVYQQLGETDQAGWHYRRAVELDAYNPYALNALGQYICAQGRQIEADSYFIRALAVPFYPTPWIAAHNAGLCMAEINHFQQAEKYYRQALNQHPKFAPSLLRMADLRFAEGDFLSARHYLQRYDQAGQPTAESLWLGIHTERQLANRYQATDYILQLRAKFPDSEQARYLDRAK